MPGAGEAWALVQRAAAAHERTRTGLAGERSESAAELRAGAGALTLQVIDLAGRCRELGLELATVDVVEVEARSAALAEAAGATADEAARRDFGQAARASRRAAGPAARRCGQPTTGCGRGCRCR